MARNRWWAPIAMTLLLLVGGVDSRAGGTEGIARGADGPFGIAFRSGDELLILDEASGAIEALIPPEPVRSAPVGDLALSPTGDRLAFGCDPGSGRADPEGVGLCTIEVGSGVAGPTPDVTVVTRAHHPVRFPAWSHDGERLAYAALDRSGHGSIWVTDGQGPAETLCEDWCPLFRYYSLVWSPDGGTVATVADTPGPGGHPARIVLFDVVSHGFEFLTEPMVGLQHGPSWSPDGSRVVFSANAEGGFDLWVADVGDGSATRLTAEPDRELDPAWSPDGASIVYTARDDDGWHLRRVLARGGESEVVVRAGEPGRARFISAG